jgi:Cu-Zn family superoxide dismutase
MQSAAATLEPVTRDRQVQGSVQFFGGPDGVTVHVQVSGAAAGLHGFHIHESAECAGAERPEGSLHFNPGGRPHGAPGDASHRRHAGDLGNVLVGGDGTADQWLQNRELTFEGELGIVGRTVVLHAREDDLKSQPDGASGPGVACGVIRMTPRSG